ncbi:MAG: bifunctional 4-hydroxy-2-oxoglutarate aldolase/2-dehydro-3-deoxy-phosphogluconate aldolase, partial [Chitinophagaceae bacterium]|nr:bifunctional 4-hydroxy-2-oxoglutarate aldolase/2-dehydro-3-deoxy-phosphogluconate aldolase [Chitinophagaceae bacterium]
MFYHDDAGTCISIATALYDAGIRCIEVTNRGPKALDNFRILNQVRHELMTDLVLAAGTITTGTEAMKFVDSGADILISPVFEGAVASVATKRERLWIPGCMTPTEIHVALRAGCDLIKLFPGNVLGPHFLKAVLPLFSGIDFLATGGVEPTKENISSWFRAGAIGVSIGSNLITTDIVLDGKYDLLRNNTASLLDLIKT